MLYKIVDWNRIVNSEVTFDKTCFYFGADKNKSIDELWEKESEGIVATAEYEKYEGEWLNKENAEFSKEQWSEDLIISEIYSDCFIASPVIPSPYIYKINGTVADNWCIGDQVLVTFNNIYTDIAEGKAQGDLITIETSDFVPDPNACYKPVIYLYPDQASEISVKLDLDGKLTCTYPEYKNGWEVTAYPDGTLTDTEGMSYNYLYWEGEAFADWDFSKGFCVKDEDTAKFLETALEELGLNRREANEFIVYWLPLMQENPYNIISFQTEAYAEAAKLTVEPKPDTLIRVFMTYKASEKFVDIEPQILTSPERVGFTVVEWGGTEVK